MSLSSSLANDFSCLSRCGSYCAANNKMALFFSVLELLHLASRLPEWRRSTVLLERTLFMVMTMTVLEGAAHSGLMLLEQPMPAYDSLADILLAMFMFGMAVTCVLLFLAVITLACGGSFRLEAETASALLAIFYLTMIVATMTVFVGHLSGLTSNLYYAALILALIVLVLCSVGAAIRVVMVLQRLGRPAESGQASRLLVYFMVLSLVLMFCFGAPFWSWCAAVIASQFAIVVYAIYVEVHVSAMLL